MKEQALSKSTNFTTAIFLAAILIVQLITIDETKDLLITVAILAAGAVYMWDFRKTRILSFDDRFVYLRFFKRKETVSFENVIKIRRNLFRYANNVRMNYGYSITYLNETGVQKKAYFYVSQSNHWLWQRFKNTIIQNNPAVEISE